MRWNGEGNSVPWKRLGRTGRLNFETDKLIGQKTHAMARVRLAFVDNQQIGVDPVVYLYKCGL